jgi:endo-1,4-beta-xylanase
MVLHRTPNPASEGHPRDMNRRAFLKSSASAAAVLSARPIWGAPADGSAPGNDDILAQTDERIEKHRRGNGVIVVRGADGRPAPGVKVRIEQTRHDFLFGCNFFRFGRLQDGNLDEEYRARFAGLLNYATLGFYWPYYEPERGKPIYEYTDRVAAWCSEHGIRCKGHPLVWDFADPKWLPQDFSEIRALSNARVREIVNRYQGRIDIWDVVNEPTHLGRFKTRLGEWALSMGAVPYVREHLKIAREANPQATLLVNDYRTDPPFHQILEGLRENRKPLFGTIGIQSHMHDGGWPLHKVWSVCDSYADFGVPIHFTETTIVSGPRRGPGENWGPTTPEREAVQAEYVPRFYTALFAHPAVEAITWWDFSDNGAWQGAAAGWVRKDMSPKPVYDRMMGLIKGRWWTKSEGRTDEHGEFKTRAFLGWHRLTAEWPDGRTGSQEAHWQRRMENRFELKPG